MLRLPAEWRLIPTAPTVRRLDGEVGSERIVMHEEKRAYLLAACQPLRDIATLIVDSGNASRGNLPDPLGESAFSRFEACNATKDAEFEKGDVAVNSPYTFHYCAHRIPGLISMDRLQVIGRNGAP